MEKSASRNDLVGIDLHNQVKKTIQNKTAIVELEQRDYKCSGELLPDQFCYVSNNDSGDKRILLDIDNADGLTIDGHGARIICHGEMVPIRISRSKNVTIRNLSIDWERPFFSEGVITSAGTGRIEFEIDTAKYPLVVRNNHLFAADKYGWETEYLWNCLFYNNSRREMLAQEENWHLRQYHRAQDLKDGRFSLAGAFTSLPPVGAPIVLMHGNRVAPGIFVEHSTNVTIENVTIHHAPGMAMVAVLSRDITLDNYNVLPSGDRLFSSWVDATHFVDCDGHIKMINCKIAGQFDDASNIHGIFWKITENLPGRWLRAAVMHPQQIGVMTIRPGDLVALHDADTLEQLFVTEAVDVKGINSRFCDVELKDNNPGISSRPLVLRRHIPDTIIEVKGCEFGANRGRGLLLCVPGKIIVEENRFHVGMSAIDVLADAAYWWESGPVNDVTVKNNVFDSCGFLSGGQSIFNVIPDLPSSRRKAVIHTGITIKDNDIRRISSSVLRAFCARGLTFTNNKISWSASYQPRENGPAIQLEEEVYDTNIQDVK